MVVADGMGGCLSGELASNEALRETIFWFESLNPILYETNPDILKELWLEKLVIINQKIGDYSDDRGTTYVGGIFLKNSLLLCNIGDSRAIISLERNNQCNYFCTDDQSFSNKLYKAGEIELFDDIRFHVCSNVIENFLGNTKLVPEFFILKNVNMYDKLKLVLCSDGVTDCLSMEQILDIINSYSVKEIPKMLVNSSLNNDSILREELRNNYSYHDKIMGGKDNTTCVAYQLKKKRKSIR